MTYEFRLADLGEGVAEGEIVRWLVRAGDTVRSDQPLVEVMTDKVTAELPSPVSGLVVRLCGEEGKVVPVGSVLVEILTEASAPATHAGAASVTEHPPSAPAGPASGVIFNPELPEAPLPTGSRRRATPAARRRARELDLEVPSIDGSGPGGRIRESDVLAAAESYTAAGPLVERVPLRGMRRVIAERLMDAQRNTAPYTLVDEVDFTELVGLRERVQPLAEKSGTRMTFLPFVLAALGMTLRRFPRFNARHDPESGDLLVYQQQHFAIAVHTEEGLVVPVIRNAETRNLMELAREVERVAALARNGRLAHEDLEGGTFSVSSVGSAGSLHGTPVLNSPQVAVLGIHRIAVRPAVRDGQVVPRRMAHLSLTLDHRYIDGFEGAQFLDSLRQLLEDPAVMLFSFSELRES